MQVALGPHSVVSQCMSVMALRVLPYGRFRMPRKREFTYEEAADASNEFWISRYERDGVAIRDILAAHVVVDWFAYSKQSGGDDRFDLHVSRPGTRKLDVVEAPI